ncbi:MAG TPA: TonB-dependent receptor, partial [Vicinamibacterales bacterium]|nr:TonB-dependent receptor [Vicinamibacterales bacterium]
MRHGLSAAAWLLAAGPAWTQEPPRLEEVQVTAQRRPEVAQRAALALTVLGPQALRDAGASRPQELTELVPSLQVAASAAPISVYYLRGAGNFTGNALTDSAVAFNVDGVFVGRPHATAGFFYDLERIEILKGPQGTLYGRNATGGAINVLSRGPELGSWGGDASVEVGNEGHARVDGVVNVPLGTAAAMRAAAYHLQHDGWMNDGVDDQDDTAGRLSFQLEPSDVLSIRIVADYFDQGGRGTGSTPVALGADHRYGISSAESGVFLESQRNFIAGRNFNPMPPIQHLDNQFWGIGATLDWVTDKGTLTVLPAYREGNLDTVGTALGVNVTTLEEDRQKSLEARYASDRPGKISYIVGTYWFDETNHIPLFVPNTQYSMSVQDYGTGVESIAGFGQLTYAWTEAVRTTLGARYTDEEKFFNGSFDGAVRFCFPLPTGTCPSAERFPATQLTPPVPGFNPADGTTTVPSHIDSDESESFSKWTWRAALDWEVSDRSFLYLSYETGFKSGGFFFSSDSKVFQPEKLQALTLGSKNRLLDGRLQLDVEAFHWRYDDQQVSTIMLDSRSITNLGTRNIGNATMSGVEIETEWLVGDATRLRLDAQYLDATYDDFRYDVPTPPVSGCAVSQGAPPFLVDCSGKRMPYAPDWRLNLGIEQAFTVGGGRVTAEARLHYQSETLTGLDFTPLEYQEATTTIGASVTYTTAGDRYYVTAFGNNLTDEAAVANTFQPPFG